MSCARLSKLMAAKTFAFSDAQTWPSFVQPEVPLLMPLTKSDQPGHKAACHLPERQRSEIYQQDIASVGVAL